MKMVNRCVVLVAVLLSAAGARAGNLDSPGAPTAPASAMYRIEDVYNRLDTGAAGATQVFTDPASGPTAGTMHTLNEVMAKAPLLDAANGATAAQVLSGKTFWGLLGGGWGTLTGTMPIQTLSAANDTVAAGYYAATTLSAVDADLATANVRAGQTIFGVAGDVNVVNTGSGDALAADVASGKKAWVDGVEVTGTAYTAPVAKSGAGDLPSYTEVAGEDGHASMRRGVAWPNPRFTDNANGTVTDNLTGLIWLKNANFMAGTRTWANALTDCATLNSGEGGLTDGSVEGDWRLPNVQELQSLIDYGRYNPALCNAAGTGQWTAGDPFTGVVSSYYWSSTTGADNTSLAWGVYLGDGSVNAGSKGNTCNVWPVRGGQ